MQVMNTGSIPRSFQSICHQWHGTESYSKARPFFRLILSTCSSATGGSVGCGGRQRQRNEGRERGRDGRDSQTVAKISPCSLVYILHTQLPGSCSPRSHARKQRLITHVAQGHTQGVRSNSPAALTETIQTDMITRVAITSCSSSSASHPPILSWSPSLSKTWLCLIGCPNNLSLILDS